MNNNEKIEYTLRSLDDIKQAEAADFFETRLFAKMERRFAENTSSKWYIIQKPVWVTACVIVFTICNFFMLENKSATPQLESRKTGIELVAEEYNLNTANTDF